VGRSLYSLEALVTVAERSAAGVAVAGVGQKEKGEVEGELRLQHDFLF
jgi:hypothetical protein